jgi:hypothetical protein
MIEVELLEEEVDHGARGLGSKALAPMLEAEPIAEFRRVLLVPIDADHADRRVIMFDQERDIAPILSGGANEFDGMLLGVGMRQAAGIFRNAAIVGETRNRFCVREGRPAQGQPFGLEHAATCLAQ